MAVYVFDNEESVQDAEAAWVWISLRVFQDLPAVCSAIGACDIYELTLVSTGFNQRPRLFIRHDVLVFCAPMGVDSIPAVAFEHMRALRAFHFLLLYHGIHLVTP